MIRLEIDRTIESMQHMNSIRNNDFLAVFLLRPMPMKQLSIY